MGLARPRLVAVLACAAALAALGADTALAAKQPTARSALKTLVTQTSRLPPAAAPAAKRHVLERLARHARRSASRRPCAAVRDLARFRRVVGGIRVKKASRKLRRAGVRLSALGPASLTASRLLLASRRTRRCGGGLAATTRDAPKVRVIAADARRLRVRITLPELHFAARQGGGKPWTKLGLRTSDAPGRPGTPAIPVVSDFLAIPDGARMRLKTNEVPPGLNGETLSLLRNGDVIGKATVTSDTVRIPASLAGPNDSLGKLQVALEPDGSPSLVIDVNRQATTLSQNCPTQTGAYGNSEPFTISGHLDPAQAGATIKIRYTPPNAANAFEKTTTTDANGNWSQTIVANGEAFGEYGNWQVQARFEGDASYAGSTAAECMVNVYNDG